MSFSPKQKIKRRKQDALPQRSLNMVVARWHSMNRLTSLHTAIKETVTQRYIGQVSGGESEYFTPQLILLT